MPSCRSCGRTDEGALIRRKCMVTYLFPSERCNCYQNSKYPRGGRSSVPVAASSPSTPRRVSQAAWFSAGSELTRSRIICQAAMLRAPSGGGPIAKDTEHWEQKHIRCADDFCRGLIPTVCANMYTATDLCPASSSRLQRRQYKFSKVSFPAARVAWKGNTVSRHQSGASMYRDSCELEFETHSLRHATVREQTLQKANDRRI